MVNNIPIRKPSIPIAPPRPIPSIKPINKDLSVAPKKNILIYLVIGVAVLIIILGIYIFVKAIIPSEPEAAAPVTTPITTPTTPTTTTTTTTTTNATGNQTNVTITTNETASEDFFGLFEIVNTSS